MNVTLFLISAVFLALLGCHPDHSDSSKEKYKKLTLTSKVKVAVKEVSNKGDFIDWHPAAAAGEKFLVKKVWSKTKRRTCKSCHRGYSLQEIKGKDYPRSHWNINLKHASSQVMNCQTCHNQNKVWKFNFGEKTVSANHTPKLCLQCHFKQQKDWEIGAHGKRANGWQQQRAVYNCVSCHNPHQPAFQKKWPKVGPYRPINNEGRL